VSTGSDTMRFGLIGTGYWGRSTHATGLLAHPDVDLVGVWGRSPATTSTAASTLGVPGYQRLDDLLADVDAVALAVPPDVQAELAVLAAQRGCHLLLDKPIALDEVAAERLLRAVTSAGVAATVFFTLLYEPAVAAWVQKTAAEAWFAARIRMFSSIFAPGSPYAASGWRRERGALWDVGPHALGVAVRVLGPAESVVAQHGAGQSTDVIVRHAGGVTSSLSLSLTAPPAACGSDWTFYGDPGAVTVPVPASTSPQAYANCVTDLLRSVRTGHEPRCGVPFGLEVVRALSAAEASAATGTSPSPTARNGRP